MEAEVRRGAYMASEDEARGVGLNWARDGLKFVHISVVDFAWRLGESMGECEAEVEQENGSETEERREEDEAGELVEVGRVMRAMERRVVRRREDEQER
jgi:hypothetical protein